MSDTTHNRSAHRVDRPDEVTDPLLWGLALDVADAHQPDAAGTGCENLLCADQGWPCAAWQTAQHALRVARTPSGQRPTDRPGGQADSWMTPQTHPLRPATAEQQRRTDIAA